MKEGRKKIATGMRMKRFVALLLTLTMAMTLAVRSGRISFAKRQRDMVCRCLVE